MLLIAVHADRGIMQHWIVTLSGSLSIIGEFLLISSQKQFFSAGKLAALLSTSFTILDIDKSSFDSLI